MENMAGKIGSSKWIAAILGVAVGIYVAVMIKTAIDKSASTAPAAGVTWN
jgi:hypothetical protein